MGVTANLICDLLESFADLNLILGRSATASDGFTPLFEFFG
jgi:hypothetical protein